MGRTDGRTDGADYIGPAVSPVGRVQKTEISYLTEGFSCLYNYVNARSSGPTDLVKTRLVEKKTRRTIKFGS